MKQKGIILFLLSLSVYLLAAWGYIFHNGTLQTLDNRLSDLFFKIRGDVPADPRIAIIDIDEKSLARLGRWPWSRDVLARIIENLHRNGAAIISLDMVFAEEERRRKTDDRNNDKILAEVLDTTPTVTGIFIDFRNDPIPHNPHPPTPSAIFVERGKPVALDPIPTAASLITNIPTIQQHALSFGFVNTIPDPDGIIRRIPLLIRYQRIFYPALSFETVRLLGGSRHVEIDYSAAGVDQITTGAIAVETDRFGQMRLNYRSNHRSYTYISAVDVYEGRLKPTAIKNKILIFGSSAAGLLDLRATPMAPAFAGVEIQAVAMDNLIHGDYLITPDWSEGAEIAGMGLITLCFWLLFLYAEPLFATAIGGTTVIGWYYLAYRLFLDHHIIINILFPMLLMIELIFVLGLFNHYYESRSKRSLRQKFAKKVSPQVLEDLMRNTDDKRVIRKEVVTIFFSDIRNFTTLGEKMKDPQKLVDYLNRYMTPMAQIIIDEQGTIDKYIGDAVMAYWNAPLPVENHEERAVRTALRQIKTLQELNRTFERDNLPPIEIGIGIHTGEAIVGEMGSEGRSDYTIIGDNVNLASRIEGINKIYGTTILITEATYKGISDPSLARKIDRVKVKGKEEPVDIYEVFTKTIDSKERLLHQKALEYYQTGNAKKAKRLFIALQKRYPSQLYYHFIQRCEQAIHSHDGYLPILVLRR